MVMHCPHRVAGMGEIKRMVGYVDGRFVRLSSR
jgi:hypothetical protein